MLLAYFLTVDGRDAHDWVIILGFGEFHILIGSSQIFELVWAGTIPLHKT